MADGGSYESSGGENTLELHRSTSENKFVNDGSFLEMFRKKMEEEKNKKQTEQSGQLTSNEAMKPLTLNSESTIPSGSTAGIRAQTSITVPTESKGNLESTDSSTQPKKPLPLPFVRNYMGILIWCL